MAVHHNACCAIRAESIDPFDQPLWYASGLQSLQKSILKYAIICVEYVGCHVWVKDLKMKSRSFRGRY
jgi:hypothetical protein